MLHGEKQDLMAKQINQRPSPCAGVRMHIKHRLLILLSCPLRCISQRFLQGREFGPPPCQRSSVFGVIEVGALCTEAARSLLSKIARCQMDAIR
jgi:hypothetical protein